jgi:hypothetical protein
MGQSRPFDRTSIHAVGNNRTLGNTDYEGEYVIVTGLIYRIEGNGRASVLGDTNVLLRIG